MHQTRLRGQHVREFPQGGNGLIQGGNGLIIWQIGNLAIFRTAANGDCLMSFKILCKQFGTPLFASRLCHQRPRYMSWRPDPQSIAADALHHDWKNQFCYAFPPFSLIGRVLRKVRKDQTKLIIVTHTWQSQSW